MKLNLVLDIEDLEEGTLEFSNGAHLDYALTDYDPKRPHRIAGNITMYDQGITASVLQLDTKQLVAVAHILHLIPKAHLEIIQDECQEYIYFLTNEEFKTLLS